MGARVTTKAKRVSVSDRAASKTGAEAASKADVGLPQDELNLFLVREMERLSLLVERLKDRGIVTDEDFVVSELDAKVRDLKRRIKIAKQLGDQPRVEQLRGELRSAEERLNAMK